MEHTKLAWTNLKYILCNSELLGTRLVLGVSSLLWALWSFVASTSIPALEHLDDGYESYHLICWGVGFVVYGVWSLYNLLTKHYNKATVALCSSLGTILWTSSILLLILVKMQSHAFPMGGAHWGFLIMSWWVFLKDCSALKDKK